MRNRWTWPVLVALLASVGAAGCNGGGSQKTMLIYTLPAQLPVPAAVQQVAVVKFKALQATDDTYGEVAAAKLNDRLIRSGRFGMYDRRHLAQVIEEQDFRESGLADPSKVRTKLPSVDAIITGSINTPIQVGWEQQTVIGLDGNPRQVTVQFMVLEANLSFTMINVNTAQVIASDGAVAKYDSRERKGLMGALSTLTGMGGNKLPPVNTKLAELIDECVDRLAAKIAPYQVQVPLKLPGGTSPFVKTGNRFAKRQEWGEAEPYYRQAVAADVKGEDHGAHFCLGVALEGLGRLDEAAAEYRKAIAIKDDQDYVDALARVKRFGAK